MMKAQKRIQFIILLLVLCLSIQWHFLASADQIIILTVLQTGDDPSEIETLRGAINSGLADIIDFDLGPGAEINLTLGTIDIPDDLIIDGGNQVTIRPTAGSNTFNISATDVTIQNLIIDGDADSNGSNDGAGIAHTAGALTLENVRIENTTGSNGSAISSSGTSLIASNVDVEDATGSDGAVRIAGSTNIAFNDVTVRNISGLANSRALTFASSGTGIIRRGTFSGSNDGTGNIVQTGGTLDIANVTIANSTSNGISVGGGATAKLSYVTIAGNAAAGVVNGGSTSVKDVIIYQNGSTCSGNTLQLRGRSFIDQGSAACGLSNTSLNVNLSPQIVSGGTNAPLFYSLLTTSPAIDRGVQCTTYDGASLAGSVDPAGNFRPQGNACDPGAYELPGALIPPTIITFSNTNLNMVEQTPEQKVSISITANKTLVEPFQIQFTDPSGNCYAEPSTVTMNSTVGNVNIGVRDDTVIELDHTCTVTAQVIQAPTDPVYNPGIALTPIEVNITDNDTNPRPQVNFNYNAFDFEVEPYSNGVGSGPGEQLVEGAAGEQILVTLNQPPTGNVRVDIVEIAGFPNQCIKVDGPKILDASNWDTGVTITIAAVDDGIFETNYQTCRLRSQWVYEQFNETNTSNLIEVYVRADNNPTPTPTPIPQQILLSKTSTTLAEGDPADTFTFSVSQPILAGSTEQYLIQFTVVPTGAANNNAPTQCEIESGGVQVNSIILNDAANLVSIDVIAVQDGFLEDAHGCTIQTTVISPPSTSVINVQDINVSIPPDASANPVLTILNVNSGEEVSGAVNGTIVEGRQYIELQFSLDRPGFGNVELMIEESSHQPTQPDSPDNQCFILDSPTSPSSPVTDITLSDTTPFSVFIVPRDDPFNETTINSIHNCVITVTDKIGNDVLLTYTLNIIDDEVYAVYTVPNVLTTPIVAQEVVPFPITIGITRAPEPPNTPAIIQLTTQNPSLCEIRNLNGTAITQITLTPGQLEQTVLIYPFGERDFPDPDRLCTIKTVMSQIPTNYSSVVTNGDTFVPDLSVTIKDFLVPPTPTVFPPGLVSPTPLERTSTPATADGAELIQTQTQQALLGTVFPTATPIPASTVTLIEEVDQLPVRTGPYLGASIVTVAFRLNSEGQTISYPVLAQNSDENGEVTWYYIVANGRRGWASGRSLILNEGLPISFQGSIFDSIDGSPDLGVFGTLVRDREVHRRPSTRSAVIGYVPEGASVSIIGRTREIFYDDWYHIRYGGQVGWILSDSRLEQPAVIANEDQLRDLVPVR